MPDRISGRKLSEALMVNPKVISVSVDVDGDDLVVTVGMMDASIITALFRLRLMPADVNMSEFICEGVEKQIAEHEKRL